MFWNFLCVRRAAAVRTTVFGALLVALTACSQPAHAIIFRNDLTDQQVQQLAQQGQFAGTGFISNSGSSGTAVAIAPNWLLSARHVVGNGTNQTFLLDGVQYSGVSISRPGSDLALVRLNRSLPATTVLIAPNPGHPVNGNLVWKVGRGVHGPVGGPNNPGDFTQRAGTNVITQTDSSGLRFNNSNVGSRSTSFEVSTGPGDSGGPLFLQHNNQWFVAGTTFGIEFGGVANPFIENDVAANYDWILEQVRAVEGAPFNFTPQPAPAKITFDRDFTTPGVQSTNLPGFAATWNNDRPMFHANGLNYTWENDAPPIAVFGTSDTSASIVTVADDIVFSGIEFAPTAASSGPFQIVSANSGGTLTAAAGGAFIEANEFAAVSARLAGSNDVTKTGSEALQLNGDNSNFAGQLIVQEGTLIVNAAQSSGETFGTGGFTASTKTVVENGATLQLRRFGDNDGITSNEHLHISGTGDNGIGAIHVDNGNHVFTEPIALQADSTIHVDAGGSITFGGPRGSFYRPGNLPAGVERSLTQRGQGTVVYDNLNNITALSVINGVAAGDGGVGGAFALTAGAELRPGDSADAMEFGTFATDDFSIDDASILTIDLDPESMLVDLVDVNGLVRLAGNLNLNLFSAPTQGDEFLIIQNDGSDAVFGMFASGQTLSATFAGQSFDFAINYAAGTGNDVFLSFAAIPEPSSFAAIAIAVGGIATRRRRS